MRNPKVSVFLNFWFGAVLIFFGSGLLAQTTPPNWVFEVRRSEHFEIIYQDSQKNLAELYLKAAEKAYAILFPIFKEAPEKPLIEVFVVLANHKKYCQKIVGFGLNPPESIFVSKLKGI